MTAACHAYRIETDMLALKLFVTGETPNSRAQVDSLRQLLEQSWAGRYHLEVINIFDTPEEAEVHQVFATPTLIKTLPEPMRRIIGDLRDREKVLAGLDLVES